MAEIDVAYIVDDGTYLREAGYLNGDDGPRDRHPERRGVRARSEAD